jgi:alcohol dehydrogenase (cytochrome c)
MGKIGILWEMDRRTGKHLRATDLGLQNVLDLNPATGAVKYRPEKIPVLDKPVNYCPAPLGGRSWPSMSYSPDVQAIYVPYLHTCATMTFRAVERKPGGGGQGQGPMEYMAHPDAKGKPGVLAAMSLDGKILWEQRQRAPFVSATLATAGGLLFAADYEGYLHAFDVKTGASLWRTRLPLSGHGFPASYAAGGRQFLAMPVGQTTVLEMFTPQFVPEIVPAKGDNALVVFALPRSN